MFNLETAPTLSPAQKAWQTRRLRDAAREVIEARKVDAVEASPLASAVVVSYYVDDPRVGLGWRRFVVTEVGPRWVQLVCSSSLVDLRVDRLSFDRYAKAAPFKKRALAAILERNAEQVARLWPDQALARVELAEKAVAVVKASRGGQKETEN